jgi:AsmA protein
MKKLLWLGGGLISLLALVVFVAPAFVDLGWFKSTYLPLMEDALNRRIDVGEVRLRLLPAPSIRLSRLTISDTPEFRDNTLFTAYQILLHLKLWPLLRGRFEITELVVNKPIVNLLKQPDGTFNYADIAAKKAQGAKKREIHKKVIRAQDIAAVPLALPSRLRIRDGRLKLETKGQEPVRIDGVDLALEEFSADKPIPYRASFNYPGLKTVSLEGAFIYREAQADLQIQDNRLQVRDLLLPVQGTVTDLAAVPRVDLTLADPQAPAKAVFDLLSVFGLAPTDTEVSGPIDLRLTIAGPSNNLITQVHGKLRDVQVQGKRALKGLLNGEIVLKLPIGSGEVTQRVKGSGRLVARDGELTNANIVEKIQRVTGLMGMSKQARREATTFEILESEFTISGGVADFARFYLANPQLEVSGHGTMTLNRPVLNLRLDAALSPGASSRSGRAGIHFKDRRGRIVVPLKITGRAENPSVHFDSERAFKRGVDGNVQKGLAPLFKNLLDNK